MRRQRTSLQRFALAVLVIALLGLVIALALLVRPAGAQVTLPVLPSWHSSPRGETLADPMSWWADGLVITPTVTVEFGLLGGQGGISNCVDDGSGLALRCVIWVQGDWQRVIADGFVIAERSTTFLPVIYRSHSTGRIDLTSTIQLHPSPPESYMSARLSFLLGFLLLVFIARPAAASPTDRLILVDSLVAGDEWTPERAEAVRLAAERARAWWAERLGESTPAPLAVEYLSTEFPHDSIGWVPARTAGLQIFVTVGDASLMTGREGAGWPGRVLVIEAPDEAPLDAVIAHELGHALYELPDQPRGSIDIMAGSYPWAFERGVLGCRTSAELGRPCDVLTPRPTPDPEPLVQQPPASYRVTLPLLAGAP